MANNDFSDLSLFNMLAGDGNQSRKIFLSSNDNSYTNDNFGQDSINESENNLSMIANADA